ncbi:putative gas vesicle protein GvpJ 1 [Ktedonobacter sp. SOSP1-52]|uniref:gas vesicle protein n=1 Tax=Ktedonobacter sp. SOSP1-52 TaxID=2778366 RepID=UPI001916B676|nr:gas vesicle protein [Ktedonobacter sp. SOSP1-52]GHO70899.1 putative gas vesicle protein GvpJ 1 [Ktedonobacter sp. SOSP1-52]
MPEQMSRVQTANLADVLDRVLDKGLVIVGDIKINLVDVELLTIKIRLLVASVDKAKSIGIDWWEHDPFISSGKKKAQLAAENGEEAEGT